ESEMVEALDQNPLAVGLGRMSTPQPNTLVIFGAAGDLTSRKLLPAVYNLAVRGLLPAHLAAGGVSRRDMHGPSFRKVAHDAIAKYSRRPLDPAYWSEFERGIFHSKGNFDDPEAYAVLRRKLQEIDVERGIPGNRVYYLSIPPSTIATCVDNLKR